MNTNATLNTNKIESLPLSRRNQWLLAILSFGIVAFGQPAWSWILGLLTAVCGYTLFFRILLSVEKNSTRFWLGTLWYLGIEAVHSSWFISHPFLYIYGVWVLVSLLCGLQFGLVSILINLKRMRTFSSLLVIASAWTLMEWMRIFLLSGYSFNPSGIALTGHIYPLQMASLWGVYGLTFWVILVNLLLLRAWVIFQSSKEPKNNFKAYVPILLWLSMALIPYAYGYIHFSIHEKALLANKEEPTFLSVVLVQPSFVPEENMQFQDAQSAIAHVVGEWQQILKIVSKHKKEKVDLVVLPEFVVPYGTYSPIYPLETIRKMFSEFFGKESLGQLPPLEEPWSSLVQTRYGPRQLVNNAFIVQGISNIFQAEVVAGLEDAEQISDDERQIYSSAICFHCDGKQEERYEKRVLVPLGEYIPFSFCRQLAASYGVTGSFTPGTQAKVFTASNVTFGCCICYEETFGHLMSENRRSGANMLVNITSDVWYPNSRLPQQHLDHARLRTVENGIPLVRACNTGVTCAVDSLGRVVASLGENDKNFEWISDSLKVDVPLYHYQTPYSKAGDIPIIGFCLIVVLNWLRRLFIKE